jgi:hypothetical protein
VPLSWARLLSRLLSCFLSFLSAAKSAVTLLLAFVTAALDTAFVTAALDTAFVTAALDTLVLGFVTAALDTFAAVGVVDLVVATVPVLFSGPGTGMVKAGATAMRAMMVFLTSMMVVIKLKKVFKVM